MSNNTSVYLAIHTTEKNNSVTSTPILEERWAARKEVLFEDYSAPGQSGSKSLYLTNKEKISFTRNGGGDIKVTHFSLWTDTKEGSRLAFSELSTARTLNGQDILEFNPGSVLLPINKKKEHLCSRCKKELT